MPPGACPFSEPGPSPRRLAGTRSVPPEAPRARGCPLPPWLCLTCRRPGPPRRVSTAPALWGALAPGGGGRGPREPGSQDPGLLAWGRSPYPDVVCSSALLQGRFEGFPPWGTLCCWAGRRGLGAGGACVRGPRVGCRGTSAPRLPRLNVGILFQQGPACEVCVDAAARSAGEPEAAPCPPSKRRKEDAAPLEVAAAGLSADPQQVVCARSGRGALHGPASPGPAPPATRCPSPGWAAP